MDFDHSTDPSKKSRPKTISTQAEFAEFSAFGGTSPRSWFENSSVPRSIDHATTPAPFDIRKIAAPLSAAATSTAFAASGLTLADFPLPVARRFSTTSSIQASMANSVSSASFGVGYGAVPAYGADFTNPASPFTTADDTDIIEELCEQDMGMMLGNQASPSMLQGSEFVSTMAAGIAPPCKISMYLNISALVFVELSLFLNV